MRDVLLTSLESGSLKPRFFYWDILFQRELFSCILFYSAIVLNDQIIVYRRGFQVPVIHLQVPHVFLHKVYTK